MYTQHDKWKTFEGEPARAVYSCYTCSDEILESQEYYEVYDQGQYCKFCFKISRERILLDFIQSGEISWADLENFLEDQGLIEEKNAEWEA